MSEERQNDGLTAKEVVEKVFEKLKEGRVLKEITFANEAETVIADDSDWHRTRRGYMHYKSVVFCGFNSKTFALGLGEAGGSYPAEPYYNDIIVLELSPETTEEELQKEIAYSDFFRNSILIGLKEGGIGAGRRAKEKLKALDFSSFITQHKEVDSRYLSLSTLGPVVTQPTLWKEELVGYLAENIIQILAES